jgi:hypothetical protein
MARTSEPRDPRRVEQELAVAAERWRWQIVATALACLLVLAVSAAVILQVTDIRTGLLVLSHIGFLAVGAVAGAGWALRKIAEERAR